MSGFFGLFITIILFAFSAAAQTATDKQKDLTDKSLTLFQQGKVDEAVAANAEVVSLMRNSGDTKSDKFITALINAAFMKKSKLEAEEKAAREKYREAVKDAKGKKIEDYGMFTGVGNLAADAEANLREALEISRATGKIETPLAATAMKDLALILQKNFPPQEMQISRKRIDEAEQLFARAIAVQEKTLGDTNPKTLQTSFNFISLYDRFSNYAKILSLMPAYLNNAEKGYGQNSRELLPALRLYASILYLMKMDGELDQVTAKIKQIDSQSKDIFPVRDLAGRQEKIKLPRIPSEFIQGEEMKLREDVLVKIDETGKVAKAAADKNLPYRMREALEDAVKSMTFKPLIVNGNAVSYRGKFVFDLNLTKRPA